MKSTNKYFIQGLELSGNENYRAAIDLFTRAIETEENPEIYYERALAYFHSGDIHSALVDLNHAQELDPENPFRYSSRAFVRDKNGDLEGAMEDYKKAIELDPTDAIAFNNLGLLEEKAGFQGMASDRFKTADELAENTGLFNEFPPSGKINMNGNSKKFSLDFSQSLKIEKGISSMESGGRGAKIKFRPSEYLREIYHVFSRKSVWLEFLQFIKNGGKIK